MTAIVAPRSGAWVENENAKKIGPEGKNMSYLLDGKRIVMGTCYYPEQWPRSMWEEDLRRMKETGIEVIRIAEFAWNKTEIREGVFDYSFFDGFLDLCEKTDMKVIFCTPTATPPAAGSTPSGRARTPRCSRKPPAP